MKAVGVPFVKKDAKALVTGKPVYTNDPGDQDRCGNACAGN